MTHALFKICSYIKNQVLHIPIGGKIPDMDHMSTTEEEVQRSKELAVSALHYTGGVSALRIKIAK